MLKIKMVEELSFDTALTVIESWEVLRRKKDYAETTGRGLFIRFFNENPNARKVFGFEGRHVSEEFKKDDDDESSVYNSEKFLLIGKSLVEMVDQAVEMLGPDLETVAEVLIEMGERHKIEYGIQPMYYPLLGTALLDQLEDELGPKLFTISTRKSWLRVYRALAIDIEKTKASR